MEFPDDFDIDDIVADLPDDLPMFPVDDMFLQGYVEELQAAAHGSPDMAKQSSLGSAGSATSNPGPCEHASDQLIIPANTASQRPQPTWQEGPPGPGRPHGPQLQAILHLDFPPQSQQQQQVAEQLLPLHGTAQLRPGAPATCGNLPASAGLFGSAVSQHPGRGSWVFVPGQSQGAAVARAGAPVGFSARQDLLDAVLPLPTKEDQMFADVLGTSAQQQQQQQESLHKSTGQQASLRGPAPTQQTGSPFDLPDAMFGQPAHAQPSILSIAVPAAGPAVPAVVGTGHVFGTLPLSYTPQSVAQKQQQQQQDLQAFLPLARQQASRQSADEPQLRCHLPARGPSGLGAGVGPAHGLPIAQAESLVTSMLQERMQARSDAQHGQRSMQSMGMAAQPAREPSSFSTLLGNPDPLSLDPGSQYPFQMEPQRPGAVLAQDGLPADQGQVQQPGLNQLQMPLIHAQPPNEVANMPQQPRSRAYAANYRAQISSAPVQPAGQQAGPVAQQIGQYGVPATAQAYGGQQAAPVAQQARQATYPRVWLGSGPNANAVPAPLQTTTDVPPNRIRDPPANWAPNPGQSLPQTQAAVPSASAMSQQQWQQLGPGPMAQQPAGSHPNKQGSSGPHTLPRGGSGGSEHSGGSDGGDRSDGADQGRAGAVGPDGKPKPRRRRNRNQSERAQMLNKAAQQRYRERKKTKALELELTVQALAEKAKAFSLVQAKHDELAQRNAALQAALLQKEAELNEVKTSAPGSGRQAHSNDGSNELRFDRAEGLRHEAETLTHQLHGKVHQLKDLLKGADLDKGMGVQLAQASAPPHVAKLISTLVEEVSAISMRAMRVEGVDIWAMVHSSAPQSRCPQPCGCLLCKQRAAWLEVAQGLQLTPDQRRKMAFVRQDHQAKLQRILRARQLLNLEAVSVMLPQDRGGSAPEMMAGTTSSFAVLGFFQRARHTSRATKVLETLKDNLRQEQRALSELDYILFRRILLPLQGAWLILEAYPRKCDCPALMQAVAELEARGYTWP